MLRVGLTGGIGAGKSAVAARLAERGAVLIDADLVAREVVELGTPGLAGLVAEFGPRILLADGRLDRGALGRVVFGDEDARRRLNTIVHPLVGSRTAELMAAAGTDAVVVNDVPLLVENGMAAGYHLVVVVEAPRAARIQRLVTTRGMTAEAATARMSAQASDAERRAVADVLIDNSGAEHDLDEVVDRLWTDRLTRYAGNLARGQLVPWPEQVVQYDQTWPDQYRRAAARLRNVLGDIPSEVEHVGPTSVPGTAARDVLELQVALASADVDGAVDRLDGSGWVAMPADEPAPTFAADPRLQNGIAEAVRWAAHVDPGRPATLRIRQTG